MLVLCRCRKLPRALKDWQAFEDLKKTIDDFNEMVPLLELMTNKAMKQRHWNRMAEVTGHVFDIDSDNFALKNILQAPLLEFKEDIEVRLILVQIYFLSLCTQQASQYPFLMIKEYHIFSYNKLLSLRNFLYFYAPRIE